MRSAFLTRLLGLLFAALPYLATAATNLPPVWLQMPGSPPESNIRSDDIHFVDENIGFGTRNTKIYKTTDGGVTWNAIFTNTATHFRSISFLTPLHGFAGNLGQGSYDAAVTDTNVLYETFDAGTNWHVFQGLSQQGMKGFCAMQAYDSNTFYGGGRVRGPAFFVKSTDGGTNFSVYNLTASNVMNAVMDVYFHDTTNGWLCGMDMNAYSSTCSPQYFGRFCKTTDGGNTWTPVVTVTAPACSYFWKFAWPSRQVGYCALQQNGTQSFVIYYKTTDGGNTWQSNGVPLSVVGGNALYTQGIGFCDVNTGWIGGAAFTVNYTNCFIGTTNGGTTWFAAGYNDSTRMNHMRFPRPDWGYGSGTKYHLYRSPLAITNPPLSQTVVSGNSAQFQVGVHSYGKISYQWQSNGVNLLDQTNATLNLANVSTPFAANYSVIATNTNGFVSSIPVALTVLSSPLRAASISGDPAGSLAFTWNAIAGTSYGFEYKDNYTDAQWTSLGTSNSGSSTISVSDGPVTNAQRFYHVSGPGQISEVVGMIRIPLPGNSDTFVSFPFARSSTLLAVDSVSGNVINLGGSPNWSANQFVYASGTQTNTYYARFKSGASEGRVYPITANGTATLTVNLGSDSLAGVSQNDLVSIEPAWTLGTAFANGAGVNVSPTAGNRNTEVLLQNLSGSGINLSSSRIYYFNAGVWKLLGDGNVDHGNDVIEPNSHFIVRHNVSTNTTWTTMGVVIESKVAMNLRAAMTNQQDNFIGLLRPFAVSLDDSGLITGGAFTASPLPGNRTDELLRFDNSAMAKNKSAAAVYYYWNGAWRQVGAGTSNVGTVQAFAPGTGVIIRKGTNGSGVIWTNSN